MLDLLYFIMNISTSISSVRETYLSCVLPFPTKLSSILDAEQGLLQLTDFYTLCLKLACSLINNNNSI